MFRRILSQARQRTMRVEALAAFDTAHPAGTDDVIVLSRTVTAVAKRDDHLRSADVVGVERHPPRVYRRRGQRTPSFAAATPECP